MLQMLACQESVETGEEPVKLVDSASSQRLRELEYHRRNAELDFDVMQRSWRLQVEAVKI